MHTAKIIIGQTNSSLTAPLSAMVAGGEYEVHTADRGDRILEILCLGSPPDLVVIEESIQGPDPFELCQAIKSRQGFAVIPVLLIAPNATTAFLQSAVTAGFDDVLNQPFAADVFVARVKSLVRLKQISDEKDDAESVLRTLARTIETKDQYTLGHADRVSQFAVELGQKMGVSGADVETLRKGGMLHDIGKIAIPDSILTKPGRYTPDEFSIMKRHPTLGCEICQKLKSVQDALPLIRHHHEKLDGTGYPDGLKGDQIPALVRVVTVVDIYDALRSQRSYKEAFTLDKSFQILWEEADKGWWDKSVVGAWETIVRTNKTHP